MLGIPLGLLYANAGEWLVHKHLLHGAGRRKTSPWAFHWHEHHRACRKHAFVDPHYERPLLGWHAQSKEALGLAAAAAVHLPLLPIAPFFTGAVLFSIANYYRVHKKSHEDPEWAKKHLPWHYDHHVGPDQDANWCVSWPWFDWIMGTREPYLGSEKAERDEARRVRARSSAAPGAFARAEAAR